MTVLLDVRALEVRYGAVQAVKRVDLSLKEGQIVALLGANGAGKSSIIKSLIGVVKPWTGTIEFMGRQIQGLPVHDINRLGIGWVPEGRQVFSHLTVEANLMVGAFAVRDTALVRRRLHEMMEMFPILEQRRTQLAGLLSGGEQQMLAFARALMSGPRILLLDEPTLGLSPLIVQHLFEMVKQIRSRGLSILMAEQNARQSLKVADEAYLLELGEVRGSGTAREMEAREDVRRAYLGG
jgi:branched-chain amino acid transport system ATP-binding protein